MFILIPFDLYFYAKDYSIHSDVDGGEATFTTFNLEKIDSLEVINNTNSHFPILLN